MSFATELILRPMCICAQKAFSALTDASAHFVQRVFQAPFNREDFQGKVKLIRAKIIVRQLKIFTPEFLRLSLLASSRG